MNRIEDRPDGLETRYTVFKDADLRAAAKAGFISEQDIVNLCRVEAMVAGFRRQQRKPELRYVVFQSNWEVYHDAKRLLQTFINWKTSPTIFGLPLTEAEKRQMGALQGEPDAALCQPPPSFGEFDL